MIKYTPQFIGLGLGNLFDFQIFKGRLGRLGNRIVTNYIRKFANFMVRLYRKSDSALETNELMTHRIVWSILTTSFLGRGIYYYKLILLLLAPYW